jgi:hypothetical protein
MYFYKYGKNIIVYFSRVRKEIKDWGQNLGLREGNNLIGIPIFRGLLYIQSGIPFMAWSVILSVHGADRPNCRSHVIDLSLSAIGFSNNLKLHFAVLEKIV